MMNATVRDSGDLETGASYPDFVQLAAEIPTPPAVTDASDEELRAAHERGQRASGPAPPRFSTSSPVTGRKIKYVMQTGYLGTETCPLSGGSCLCPLRV